MAKGANQKLKLLYLMKILLENTDEEHGMTMPEILSELAQYDVTAERKSIYSDIELLRVYGLDVVMEKKDRKTYYQVVSRDFELAELKLLVDAVQSSKFITAKKSRDLIGKLEKIASRYEANQLQRQVYVHGRIKTMNESIYYNVDDIHRAIANNTKITFHYYQWNVKKEMELRRDGRLYEVSPWALSWDDENYYLVAYDEEEGMLKHFRVDKMRDIAVLSEKRAGKEAFGNLDMAAYSKARFAMYGGEEKTVHIECENRFAGVMIDRFGNDVKMRPSDEEHFVVNVEVAVSAPFVGWIIALGDGVEVIGPEEVIEEIRKQGERICRTYGGK